MEEAAERERTRMNPRLELYRRGGGLIVRTIYIKGGRRAFVLDPDRRARAAVAALLRQGLKETEVAHSLGRTVDFVRLVRSRMPGGKNWI
jgi:hypothetical protein